MLTFSDRGRFHQYRLDDDRVPSVTTIVNGGIPKPSLAYWAAKVVAEAAADQASTIDALRSMGRGPLVSALKSMPDQIRDTAAARGTEVHRLAALVVTGEPSEVIPDEDIAACVEGLARWFDAVGFEVMLAETIVGSRAHRYAGRFDILGTLAADRSLVWLLDLKTSSSVYGDTALQVAAYASAEFYMAEDNGEPVERPMPHVDRIGVVHVQPGISELYDLGDIAPSFAEFLAAQTIYAGNARRDGLVRTPVKAETRDPLALFR